MDSMKAQPEIIELSDDDEDDQQRDGAVVDLTLDDNEFLLPPSPDMEENANQNARISSNAISTRIDSPPQLAETGTLNAERASSPMQGDDNLPHPSNTRVELSKLFTPSPEGTPMAKTAPLSKPLRSSPIQPSSSPHIDSRDARATDNERDHEKVAKKIRAQILDDHETDVVNILEASLHNCLERPLSAYLQTTSFLNPAPKIKSICAAYSEEPSKVSLSSITITSHEDLAGYPCQVPITVKDTSQEELAKIPEYSRYITIERSFHAKHPESPPNSRKPEQNAIEAVAERGDDIEKARKVEREEKARNLSPYRDQIRKAIKKTEAEGQESERRMKDALKNALGIDEDGLRILLYKDRISESPLHEADSQFVGGCLACATHHAETPLDGPVQKRPTDPKPSKQTEKLVGFNRPVEAKPPASGSGLQTPRDREPLACSEKCYREIDNLKHNLLPESTSEDHETIKLAHDLGVAEPCDIAALLGLLCIRVHDYMVAARLELQGQAMVPAKKPPENWNSIDIGNEHSHDKRLQPTPCYHPGISCSKAGETKCSCVEQQIYCYKTCACHSSCRRRYPGCKCTGAKACNRIKVANPDGIVKKCNHTSHTFNKNCNGCKLKGLQEKDSGCLCQQLNRECDPDVCKCGVAGVLNESKNSKPCYNCDLQKGGMRDMVIGASAHAGYGLFLNEPVKFGNYLGEYVGEIITREEADTRENLRRKKLDPGYLFSINAVFDIDSAHFGNATRFINHTNRHQNCHSLIKLVNCEHRIGFWSTRDSPAGTELLFNYGRDFEEELTGASARDGRAKPMAQISSQNSDVDRESENEAEQEDEEGESEEDDFESAMGDVQMATKDDTDDDDAVVDEDDGDEYTERL